MLITKEMGVQLTATQAIEAIFVAEKELPGERGQLTPLGEFPRDPAAEKRAKEEATAQRYLKNADKMIQWFVDNISKFRKAGVAGDNFSHRKRSH